MFGLAAGLHSYNSHRPPANPTSSSLTPPLHYHPIPTNTYCHQTLTLIHHTYTCTLQGNFFLASGTPVHRLLSSPCRRFPHYRPHQPCRRRQAAHRRGTNTERPRTTRMVEVDVSFNPMKFGPLHACHHLQRRRTSIKYNQEITPGYHSPTCAWDCRPPSLRQQGRSSLSNHVRTSSTKTQQGLLLGTPIRSQLRLRQHRDHAV